MTRTIVYNSVGHASDVGDRQKNGYEATTMHT